MHALQVIAESGAKQIPKVEKLRTHNMDKSQGWTWAQGCIALCMTQASDWTNKAHQLFAMNIEEREAAIKAWRDWKSAETKAYKAEVHTEAEIKNFKSVMGTMTVRLSHLSTIAKALTAGMDYETLAQQYKKEASAITIDEMYAVAKTYTTSAAGRKPDTFMVKLGKFLEAQAKAITPDTPASEVDQYNAVVKFYNGLTA